VDSAPIIRFDEIDSTNAEARRRGDAGDAGPLWITAARQSAGRGRRGRTWETAEGNLAATYFFTTDRSAGEVAQHAFIAALAVADLASAYVPESAVSVKWPNDVLIGGRKTAGTLIESSGRAGGGSWVAVGIGVNLSRPPVEAAFPATAFSEHMAAPPPSPLDALEKLREAFERWRLLWRRTGFPPIAEAWTRRAHGLGEACTARLPNETVEGIAEGIDGDGALRLRVAAGRIRRITAGDVFFGGAS
jgi:BirA family biotin operon repressor/biotin-[acetyl-CoA-carboxylase] ligase